MKAHYRQAVAACIVAVALVMTWSVAAAGQSATGADVKAAFLYNFAKFVEWPAAAGTDPSTFAIGVMGDDAIVESLREFVKGKAMRGRPLSVKKVGLKEDLAKFRMLFIGASESASLPEVLKRLGTASVLTVSDADRFCTLGGVIQFRAEADRVRFDINLIAAEAAGLTLNSKLLQLAAIVNPARK